MLLELVIGLIAIFGALYYYLTKNDDFWKKKGIPYVKPEFPLITIAAQLLGKQDTALVFQQIYNQYKSRGQKYVGTVMLSRPVLMVIDLDLCRHILTKDFHHFRHREFFPRTHEYLSNNPLCMEGLEWKDLRSKINPIFIPGKFKGMFPLKERCVQQLQDHIDKDILKVGEFEVNDMVARFTIDVIASCAFGLDLNTFEDRYNEFFQTGQLIFTPQRINFLKFFLYQGVPQLANLMKVGLFHPRVAEFFTKLIKDTVEHREQHEDNREDFVSLLLKVKENKSLYNDMKSATSSTSEKLPSNQEIPDSMTLEELVAQAFVIFIAAFGTGSTSLSFCLYELAKNPSVQKKLCQEIDRVLDSHGRRVDYQALQDMPYLEQVAKETFRMYPPLHFVTRVCTETYMIPGSNLLIEKGVRVNIPLYAIQHDPELYPDPYKFDPDHFTEKKNAERHPYAFMPFGEGPRICLGSRYGYLQLKTGVVAFLSKYKLSPASNTPDKLESHPFMIFTTPKDAFKLKITKR